MKNAVEVCPEKQAGALARRLSDSQGAIRQLSPHSYVTTDTAKPLLIKIVAADRHQQLDAEDKMLEMLARKHKVPVAAPVERDCNSQWRWSVLETSGPSLSHVASPSLFRAAGEVLAGLHQLTYPHKGCFNPDLTISPANIFSAGEFKTILSLLHERELIHGDTVAQWENIDVDGYFEAEPVFCPGSFTPAAIWARADDAVEIGCLEWACAAPKVTDIAAMDLASRLTGHARFLDDFYAGYGSVDSFLLARLEFYRFYVLCLMLAFDQKPPVPKHLLVQRLEWYVTQNHFLRK